jgi:hypothetical protein
MFAIDCSSASPGVSPAMIDLPVPRAGAKLGCERDAAKTFGERWSAIQGEACCVAAR